MISPWSSFRQEFLFNQYRHVKAPKLFSENGRVNLKPCFYWGATFMIVGVWPRLVTCNIMIMFINARAF